MQPFAEQYPQYGFEKHKGYETRRTEKPCSCTAHADPR